MNTFLSYRETADYFVVPIDVIKNWINAGYLAIKPGQSADTAPMITCESIKNFENIYTTINPRWKITKTIAEQIQSKNMIKYMLTDINYTNMFGEKLYRIRTLRTIKTINGNTINKGQLGGWVAGYQNLSQFGNSWIDDTAEVFGDARVIDNAYVGNNSTVYGAARICSNAKILNEATVYDNTYIGGSAEILHYSTVQDYAHISGNAKILDGASIENYAIITDSARVADNATVTGFAYIYGCAYVHGAALITTTMPINKRIYRDKDVIDLDDDDAQELLERDGEIEYVYDNDIREDDCYDYDIRM